MKTRYRIKHDGGGLTLETAYRSTWEGAVAWAIKNLQPKYNTRHKRARIEREVQDLLYPERTKWEDTGWRPQNES